jgi:hypothetical protein
VSVESSHCGQRVPADKRNQPRHGAPVILRMVARAVEVEAALLGSMFECMMETLLWPK